METNYSSTKVTFNLLPDSAIDSYIESGIKKYYNFTVFDFKFLLQFSIASLIFKKKYNVENLIPKNKSIIIKMGCFLLECN